MNRSIVIIGLGWLIAIAPLSGDDLSAHLAQGWDDASIYRANDAQLDFTQARAQATSPADRREADFGEGVSLLNVQPKTDSNLDRAVSLFKHVRAANADDDIGIASLYFMGRIDQYQRLPPNMDRAVAEYRELFEKHPEHFWGEQAAIKLAMIEIYDAKTSAEQLQVLANYEQIADKLTNPQCQRDLFFVLGRSYLNLRLPHEKALADLLRTQAYGYSLSGIRADNYIRIAELARETNHPDVAAAYYHKFLGEFPFDSRSFTVKSRLQALTASTITAAP